MILSMLLGSLAAAAQPEGDRPIRLVTVTRGDDIELSVVGETASAAVAQYRLEVFSGPTTGNSSVQGGVARLQPGMRSELIHLRLGNVAARGWTARLTVEPQGGAAYVVTSAAEAE